MLEECRIPLAGCIPGFVTMVRWSTSENPWLLSSDAATPGDLSENLGDFFIGKKALIGGV